MESFFQQLRKRLDERHEGELFRRRKVLQSPQATEIILDGRALINFCSNDYLGLASHPDVIAACKRGLDRYGVGSGASHLVAGHSSAHHALEEELADFTGRSRALLFSSGYMANTGTLTALLGKGDRVFEDKLNHASLLDGGIYSGAQFKRYPHLDMQKLEALLCANASSAGNDFVVSDGVFSMDGDCAPLPELIAISREHRAQLMLDDAHGFGVLGKNGGGLAELMREQGHVINENNLTALIGTLGKAFGTQGAFVAGSEELIETLIQFCRPYIYTTALAPALAEATRSSLAIVKKDNWRREHLQNLITRFRRHSLQLGFTLTASETPIQGLILGDAKTALAASHALLEKGLFVSAIRPPTVPAGTARLRITFSAAHTEAQFQALLDALEFLRPHLAQEQIGATG